MGVVLIIRKQSLTTASNRQRTSSCDSAQERDGTETCVQHAGNVSRGDSRTNLGFQTPRPEIQSLDQTHTGDKDDIITSADHRGWHSHITD